MGLVDTNVLVMANEKSGGDSACVDACVDCLDRFTKGLDVLHLDSLGHILKEYAKHVQHGTPQGVGDQFFVWVSTYQATSTVCTQVNITEDLARGYVEFPLDPALSKFDWSDRKFVAVAIASGEDPTIFNATDSDWHKFSAALKRHVKVVELCLDGG